MNKTFAATITDNIILKNDLMREFEFAESTIDRWASGIANPHPLIKRAVLDFIFESRMKSEIPESLQTTRKEMVEAILVKYDPIGLIKIGAPKDEYAGEANKIISQFRDVDNVDDLAQVIWSVFIMQFSLKQAGEKSYYKLIAGEVWQVRSIRKQEVVVNKAVTNLKDKAMTLALGVSKTSLSGWAKIRGLFNRKKD